MKSFSRMCIAITVAFAALAASPTAARQADDEKTYEKLVNDHSPALVTVKFVLKMKMGQFGDNESEQEVTAIMMDPTGLVVCSNTELGGMGGLMGRMMGGQGMSATPTDIKVLIGDDTQGLEAELMARDSELDLAWVKIKAPGDKKFAHLDFTKSAKPRLGQRMLTLERMGKYFGRAPRVGEMRVAAITKKPRELISPGGESVSIGHPVFTVSGELVGMGVMQSPTSEDSGSDNPMDMLSSMSEMEDAFTALILPAEEIVKATARAKESAKSDGGEKSKDDK